jgi:hypothetical protein
LFQFARGYLSRDKKGLASECKAFNEIVFL